MPKEVIRDRHDRPSAPGVYGALEVGWSRAREHVEVGTVVRDEQDRAVHDYQWVQLDRGDINRLIRVLRQARDAAFGADA